MILVQKIGQYIMKISRNTDLSKLQCTHISTVLPVNGTASAISAPIIALLLDSKPPCIVQYTCVNVLLHMYTVQCYVVRAS